MFTEFVRETEVKT